MCAQSRLLVPTEHNQVFYFARRTARLNTIRAKTAIPCYSIE